MSSISSSCSLNRLYSLAQLLLFPTCILFISSATAKSQILRIGDPPANGILDQSKTLNKKQLAEIAEEIRKLKEETGWEFFLITFTFLEGDDILAFGEKINQKWLTGKKGIIYLYDRSNKVQNCIFSKVLSEEIPYYKQGQLRKNAENSTKGAKPKTIGEMVSILTKSYLEEFRTYYQEEVSAAKRGLSFFPLLSLLGLLLLLTFVARHVARLSNEDLSTSQSNKRGANRKKHFPIVEQPTRLGGEYSGGHSSSISLD